MPPLFELDAIRFRYGNSPPLLQGASLALHHGECLGLLGENGSGKSTLLHIGSGLLRPAGGEVRHDGRPCETEADFAGARRNLGYLLQRAEDQLFCPSILEDVAFGPYNRGYSPEEARSMAQATLNDLRLGHLADKHGSRLSGGEQKLAALATLLVTPPRLLFLDEPTNDLDNSARDRLLAVLHDFLLPAVVISHDRDFLLQSCNRFCLLAQGTIHEVGGGLPARI
jgi:cobalt/nickel transport system ATP-binding protein